MNRTCTASINDEVYDYIKEHIVGKYEPRIGLSEKTYFKTQLISCF